MNDRKEENMSVHLLNELHSILESDPLIDEVGFIHPSQFATLQLNEEGRVEQVSASFWRRDHKLGISTQVHLPLYKTAKLLFMEAIKEYRAVCYSSDNNLVSVEQVMKYSRALLLASHDFGTAWHSRKSIVSMKHSLSMYLDELRFSALIISYAPKCEHAWSHRRWVIKSISGICPTLQHIIGEESDLVEKTVEQYKMNYRAWNHRCWLVSYMSTEQAIHELKVSRNWARLHVADNSCFHYRRRLMIRILEGSRNEPESTSFDLAADVHQLWKDEFDWNESLIQLYVGREGLWLHRRFLALILMTLFFNKYSKINAATFLDSEFRLLKSCSTFKDCQFEDHQAQALYSATYMLWLAKQIPEFHGIEFLKKLEAENVKTILNKACPEKPSLWDYLLDQDQDKTLNHLCKIPEQKQSVR